MLDGHKSLGNEPQRKEAVEAPMFCFSEGMLLLTAKPPPSPPGIWRWDARQNAHSCFAIHYDRVLPAVRQQYLDILEALKAKKPSEEQGELLEWMGEGYDPDHFDFDAVNRRLNQKGRR